MAQISCVGRIWWRNLRSEATPSLYWKLSQILLFNVLNSKLVQGPYMKSCPLLIMTCIRNLSSYSGCNIMQSFESLFDKKIAKRWPPEVNCTFLSTFWRWRRRYRISSGIGSPSTFPTFSLSLIVKLMEISFLTLSHKLYLLQPTRYKAGQFMYFKFVPSLF